jgi:hypothetical protein
MINEQDIVEKLCEYLAIASHLTEFSPDSQYQGANQLALELAVWLPQHLYKALGQSISRPSEQCNTATVIEQVRRLYNSSDSMSNGFLNQHIIIHKPGIGKK